ncbi:MULTISPECIES: lasso peptide biosynthesis PqqD family chaperone [Streptomyces]|uniref:lasso peptide biosynthesis PqqD family chaperone n=1 Tax=Streptomyces TaxID=1883 RepID=UPI000BF1DB1D|nr:MULTISPECIES: lasso peptide biosynthesis PqqD family chaperone [Streptomyces]MCX4502917.1 lasso peptide biosynthesis PqqD family chaperone [Streptomyces anulatus]WTE29126.1 lasso peptide biosynthesis PqqD family chaperone [Streptomyces anulatus]
MKLRNRQYLTVTQTEYGAVLLDTKSGQYWQMNPSAAAAAQALLDGGDAADAVRSVTEQFDVDEARAADDVRAMIEAMRSAGVVQE